MVVMAQEGMVLATREAQPLREAMAQDLVVEKAQVEEVTAVEMVLAEKVVMEPVVAAKAVAEKAVKALDMAEEVSQKKKIDYSFLRFEMKFLLRIIYLAILISPSCFAWDEISSINTSFDVLGRNNEFGLFEKTFGSLKIKTEEISAETVQPISLSYESSDNPASNIEIIKHYNAIRQILTPQTFVNVVTVNTHKFRLDVYHADQVIERVNGLYQFFGDPHSYYVIENPDENGSAINKVRITRNKRGREVVNQYVYTSLITDALEVHNWGLYVGYDVSSGTALKYYQKTRELSGLVETVIDQGSGSGGDQAISSESDNGSASVEVPEFPSEPIIETKFTLRSDIRTIREGGENGQLVSYEKKSYKDFGYGFKLTKVQKSLDSNDAIILSYSSDENSPNYQKVISKVDEFGIWEKYEYDSEGRRIKTISPYLNSSYNDTDESSHSVVINDFTPVYPGDDGLEEPESPRTVVKLLKGIEVERTYYAYLPGAELTIKCLEVGALYDHPENLISAVYFYIEGEFEGSEYLKVFENGTIETYEYIFENNLLKKITRRGQADITGEVVAKGIEVIEIYDEFGYLISEEKFNFPSSEKVYSRNIDVRNNYGQIELESFMDGTTIERNFTCCKVEYLKARNGLETYYTYDELLRTESMFQGNVTYSYFYDANNNLIKEERSYPDDTTEIFLTQSYNIKKELVQETDVFGVVTHYEVGIDENALKYESSLYADGTFSEKTFSLDGKLLTLGGNAKYGRRYEYDIILENGQPRLEKSTYVVGTDESEKFRGSSYQDMLGRTVKTISPNGLVNLTTYNSKNQIIEVKSLGGNNEVLRKTTYEYDVLGNRVKTHRYIDDVNYVTQVIEYDVLNRVLKTTNENNVSTSRVFDSAGRVLEETDLNGLKTVHEYNQNGLRVRTIVAPGTFAYQTVYGYDGFSRLIKIIDHDSNVVRYEYDKRGNATKKYNALNQVDQNFYDEKGQLVRQVDALGQETLFAYDIFGKRISTKNPDGVFTLFVYDQYENLIKKINAADDPEDFEDDNDPKFLNQITSYTYDVYGNLKTEQVENGLVRERIYDNNFNVFKVVEDPGGLARQQVYTYDLLGQITEVIDFGGFETTFAYDRLSRNISKTYANNVTEVTIYDNVGNILETHKPTEIGQVTVTKYSYNQANQQIEEIVDFNGLAISTRRTYDVLGRLSSIIDANNGQTDYEYNFRNQIILERYPDQGEVVKSYDALGRLIKQINQDESEIDFEYDDLNRLVRKSSGAHEQNYSYDSLSRLISMNDNNGNQSQDSFVSNNFTYNTLNQKLSETLSVGSSANLTSISNYDDLGRQIELRYPKGRIIQTSYTVFNQVNQISNLVSGTQAVIVDYDYLYNLGANDKRSFVSRIEFGANSHLEGEVNYNNIGQVTSKEWTHNSGNQQNLLVGFNYEYDLFGNRLRDEHLHQLSDSENFAYDAAQRFNGYELDDGSSKQWSLDALANWTSITTNGNVENRTHNAVNELTSIGLKTQSYDDNGNLTFNGDLEYEWDSQNRLKRVFSGNTLIAAYYYDALNRRVRKDTGSEDIVMIYNNMSVIEELDYDTGALVKDYVLGGQYIDEIVMTSTSSTGMGYFYLNDLRYSVYGVVDTDGNLVERYKYDPYGERTVMNAGFGEIASSSVGNEYGYTGRRHDSEGSGLMYFRARYYSGELGRFVSRDPLGTALDVVMLYSLDSIRAGVNYFEGMNFYRAVFAVNFTDSSGKIRDSLHPKYHHIACGLCNSVHPKYRNMDAACDVCDEQKKNPKEQKPKENIFCSDISKVIGCVADAGNVASLLHGNAPAGFFFTGVAVANGVLNYAICQEANPSHFTTALGVIQFKKEVAIAVNGIDFILTAAGY
jgi:RHS repeat-associated protein